MKTSSPEVPSQLSYRSRLRTRVELAARMVDSFEGLCRACNGAFPSAIVGAARAAGLPKTTARDSSLNPSDPFEPEPHPLDFDWRFTNESANHLADLALQNGTSLACLGTP